MMLFVLVRSRTLPSIPLTTTATTSRQQHPPSSTFQTWSSTVFDDNGDYADINSSGSVEDATIPTWRILHLVDSEPDQQAVDEDTAEQRQTSPNNYERLDPSAQHPPAPSVYVGLNAPDVREDATNTGTSSQENDESLEPTRFSQISQPHEDTDVSIDSAVTESAAHDSVVVVAHRPENNDTHA